MRAGMAGFGQMVLAAALVAPLWSGAMMRPAFAQETGAQQVGALQMGEITVTGEGRVDSTPDMALIHLGVTTEGETAAAALAANSTEIAKVLANLTAAGITGRDVQTTGLSINPNWQNEASSSSMVIKGYIASNTVTVRVRALDSLGALLDAAVKDGANTLNGVEFGLQDPAPVQAEARKRAVADAQARAELIAGAAGVKLAGIKSISEGGAQPMPMPMLRMAADSAAAGAVPVASGEVGTLAQVTIVWTLAP